MKQSFTTIVDELKSSILAWDNVITLTRMPLPPRIQDFVPVLKLDVYYRGALPVASLRQLAYAPCDFFETSEARKKDRFFRADLPIHVDYKSTEAIESLVQELLEKGISSREHSTYGLYRLVHAIPLTQNNPWFEGIKELLGRLPEGFWLGHRANLETRMEHFVADMGQAEMLKDRYLATLAFSRFMESMLELLFTVNKEFQPSPEQWRDVLDLPILPSGFEGAFDLLLREGSLDSSRKLEVSRKILTQIAAL